MATYSVQAPDGNTYTVSGPDGATDAQVRAEVLRQHPDAGQTNVVRDMAQSLGTGLKKGVASLADSVISMIPAANSAANIATAQGSANPALPANPFERAAVLTGRAVDTVLGHNPFQAGIVQKTASAMIPDHAPQTWQGRTAYTVGQMAPAALAPGSAASRVASVVLPAAVSSVAGEGARALGASPKVEAAARVAGGIAGAGLSAMRASPKTPVPTSEDLATAKTAAYDAADNANVRYTPQATDSLLSGMQDDLSALNMNPALHKRSAAMLDQLNTNLKGQSPSLGDLDQWRQVIRRDVVVPAERAGEGGDALMGQRMIQNIDEFANAAGPDQVMSGDAQKAAQAMANARQANTAYRKVQAVEDAQQQGMFRASASGSGGNVDNATRQRMLRVFNSLNNLTPDEQAQLQSIIIGGKGQNLLRAAGKMAPGGNGLITTLELGGEVASGLAAGPHGAAMAAGPPLAGLMAKIAGDRITQGKVEQLIRLMAAGGSQKALAAAKPAPAPVNLFAPAVASLAATAQPALQGP